MNTFLHFHGGGVWFDTLRLDTTAHFNMPLKHYFKKFSLDYNQVLMFPWPKFFPLQERSLFPWDFH